MPCCSQRHSKGLEFWRICRGKQGLHILDHYCTLYIIFICLWYILLDFWTSAKTHLGFVVLNLKWMYYHMNSAIIFQGTICSFRYSKFADVFFQFQSNEVGCAFQSLASTIYNLTMYLFLIIVYLFLCFPRNKGVTWLVLYNIIQCVCDCWNHRSTVQRPEHIECFVRFSFPLTFKIFSHLELDKFT